MKAPDGLFEAIREDVAAQVEYASRLDRQFFVDTGNLVVHGLGVAPRKWKAKTLARRLLGVGVTRQFRRNQQVHRR